VIGNGGSGIVVIKVLISDGTTTYITPTTTGAFFYTWTSGGSTYLICQFLDSGTITL